MKGHFNKLAKIKIDVQGNITKTSVIVDGKPFNFTVDNSYHETLTYKNAYENLYLGFKNKLKGKITVKKQAILGALKVIQVFADYKSMIYLKISENSHKVEMGNAFYDIKESLFEAKESILADFVYAEDEYKDNPFMIGVNITYLIGHIEAIDCEELNIEVSDPSKPLITICDMTDYEQISIIMPMQLFDTW
jgi:DNA polymerase III sliding clamp (beta) subunit (PCNA family)